MPLPTTLVTRERIRDASWRRHRASALTLRWRAATVRHSFHVLPGESILELGAGSGTWTEHLVRATRGENPVTAAVFNDDLADAASRRGLLNTEVVRLDSLDEFPPHRFDYIVGHGLLGHDDDDAVLAAAFRLLRPGGQLLTFEANGSSPAAIVKFWLSGIGRRRLRERGLRRAEFQARATRHGFTQIDVFPSGILPAHTPRAVAQTLDTTAVVLEHTPGLRQLSHTGVAWLSKPGRPERPRATLTPHAQLADAVSVVIPCHNEEMNVRPVADALRETYGPYIHEIVFVDDNSTDGTADIVREMANADPACALSGGTRRTASGARSETATPRPPGATS
jgi:ubiquinone/menaquinone biosynthesis C-methylase UbiE